MTCPHTLSYTWVKTRDTLWVELPIIGSIPSSTGNVDHFYLPSWLAVSLGMGLCRVVVKRLSSVGSLANRNSAATFSIDLGFSSRERLLRRRWAAFAHAGTPTVWGVLFRHGWVEEMALTWQGRAAGNHTDITFSTCLTNRMPLTYKCRTRFCCLRSVGSRIPRNFDLFSGHINIFFRRENVRHSNKSGQNLRDILEYPASSDHYCLNASF